MNCLREDRNSVTESLPKRNKFVDYNIPPTAGFSET